MKSLDNSFTYVKPYVNFTRRSLKNKMRLLTIFTGIIIVIYTSGIIKAGGRDGYQAYRTFNLRRLSGKIQSFGPVPSFGTAA